MRPSFSLMEALEEVNQQGKVQDIELKKNRDCLTNMKVTLSKVEKSREDAQLDLKTIERKMQSLEDEMEQLQRHSSDLESESQAIWMENMRLQFQIEEEEERFQQLLAGYNTYRDKMEGHKFAIAEEESQTAVHRELVEKRAAIKRLAGKREELRSDLLNPEGNVVKQAQKEIEDVRKQISAVKEIIHERTQLLVKEQETHTRLRKDIEIQNRRCEAILRRLHCQLNKAQSNRRQLTDDICRMEEEVGDLRSCLGIAEYTQEEF
ncbi:coiled-coil domain-containing protein 122 [Megalops cyprinoides]|uniref:coiled-coil domain-containing protein 122 n=1 Tax=Megalops cyprinoides TaxID=118141 RepID=UPI001864BC79|nr:coiled-coil domain-containing protein 122 [Megalops cyprinoides]